MDARRMPIRMISVPSPFEVETIRVAVVGDYSTPAQRLRCIAGALTAEAADGSMDGAAMRRLAFAVSEVADEIEAEPPKRARWWRTAFARWWGAY